MIPWESVTRSAVNLRDSGQQMHAAAEDNGVHV
jgi:hypothetical protein